MKSIKYFSICFCLCLASQHYAQIKKSFPNLSGHTLEGSAISLPEKSAKKFTIIGICYKRSAEDALQTWIQPMYDVFVAKANKTDYFDVANYFDVNYYFIPLISGFKKAASEFKDRTQKEIWANVIDCDTDIKVLKKTLNPSDDAQPYFYVIDLTGKILEVVSGKYTEAKMDKIQEAID
ncbi:MAG: hypothetical protein ACK504_13005 [Bacteroidota bacterium]|jgi:hypothetical protein